jgi:putative tricarboxylic transport membrane protein
MTVMTSALRDRVSGAGLFVIGLGAIVKAQTGMHVGSLANMGPGFFPTVLGGCLVLTGAGLCAATFKRTRSSPDLTEISRPAVNLRTIGLVALAAVIFAITVRSLGLIPAAFLLVATSALADPRTKPATAMTLAAGLALASWLIFVAALGMPLSAFSFWQ